MRYQYGRLALNKALNTQLQGDGAIIMKKAMVILDESARREKLDFMKVIDMHDEQQNDVLIEDCTRFGELARSSIVQAGEHFNLNIPLDADVKVGDNWSETH
jgi:DNA polymerase I-like protein with 3'-5' exonuclease and polymerase domains